MEDPDRPAPHLRPNQKQRIPDPIRSSPKAHRWIEVQFGATGGTEFTLSAEELTAGPALQVGEYYWY